jgi:hypothetical protein
MIKKALTIVLILSLASSSFAQDNNKVEAEQEAIKNIIQTAYVEGLQNEGDLDKIDQGFHPSFTLLSVEQGDVIKMLPIYSWKEKVKQDKASGKLPRKGDNKVSIKFLSVDVTGNAAVAKFEFYIGDKLTFIDYLSLLKFESGWKLVSKIFYRFPDSSK